MGKEKSGWKQKLLLLAVSSLFVVALLGVGEIYCRLFTRINFLDNSRGLFQAGRFGTSYGNTPNFHGVSFGEEFFTDQNGFRIQPGAPSESGKPATLVMGDSVAFGPALTEEQAISGNLRKSMPSQAIYNGAVIGYDTFDYRNAVRGILSGHPEINRVVLVFCLNDVTDASAQLIRSNAVQDVPNQAASGSAPQRVNDYLRSRSKLYLWLKNALVDTQLLYFKSDLAAYERGAANVNDALAPIVELSRELQSRGVDFKVFVTPYESQLRPGTPPEFLVPQKMIGEFLAANEVENYDTFPSFSSSPEPKSMFLYGDPMHLSASGTKAVSDFICGKLPDCGK